MDLLTLLEIVVIVVLITFWIIAIVSFAEQIARMLNEEKHDKDED